MAVGFEPSHLSYTQALIVRWPGPGVSQGDGQGSPRRSLGPRAPPLCSWQTGPGLGSPPTDASSPASVPDSSPSHGGPWAGSQGRWGGPLFSQEEEGRPRIWEPSLHPHSFYGQKLHPVTWPPGHQPSGGDSGDGPQGGLLVGGGRTSALFRGLRANVCRALQLPAAKGRGQALPLPLRLHCGPLLSGRHSRPCPAPGAGCSKDPHLGPRTPPPTRLEKRPSESREWGLGWRLLPFSSQGEGYASHDANMC